VCCSIIIKFSVGFHTAQGAKVSTPTAIVAVVWADGTAETTLRLPAYPKDV